jgi:hypothetical protein
MTTKLIIVNQGPKAIVITGGSPSPVTVQPNRHGEVYVAGTMTVEETEPVTPNLAGGPGEPHP